MVHDGGEGEHPVAGAVVGAIPLPGHGDGGGVGARAQHQRGGQVRIGLPGEALVQAQRLVLGFGAHQRGGHHVHRVRPPIQVGQTWVNSSGVRTHLTVRRSHPSGLPRAV
ncbi:Uncharacterised protein [Mycobacteroides abscessus subsp. abscessus]|nr:Uncharacterised protein [Mycobacteroides abscessus subsp. abscessus]